MSNYSPPAVILGLGINGLGIARSLGVKRVKVWGVYERDDEVGRMSRYCKPVLFPKLEDDEKVFLEKLICELGDKNNKPILYCESDRYIFFVSKYRAELESYFRFLLPDKQLLETLISKERSVKFVASKGILIPETYFPGKNEDIEELTRKIKYPCLMKPLDSFSKNIKWKTKIFLDSTSLNKFLFEQKDIIGRVIVQEIIPGGDPNTYQATTYVSKHGHISPVFTMRKLRQNPPDFGITSCGISEDVPQLKKIVRDFLASINYRGFASIEFKEHPQTRDWYYIELNPRLPYYHSLIYDSGINLPYIYYKDMLDADENPIFYQRNGIIWIDFIGDVYSFLKKYSKGEISIFFWFLSVIKSRSYAIFKINDIKPFLYRSLYLIKRLIYKIMKKMHIRVLSKNESS